VWDGRTWTHARRRAEATQPLATHNDGELKSIAAVIQVPLICALATGRAEHTERHQRAGDLVVVVASRARQTSLNSAGLACHFWSRDRRG
jgi:hypothetical protein